MDVAGIARFLPLLNLAGRAAGDLSREDMVGIASALGGEEGKEGLLPVLLDLQVKSPHTPAAKILSSPYAQQLFQRLKKEEAEDNKAVFCRCPYCEQTFETDLK